MAGIEWTSVVVVAVVCSVISIGPGNCHLHHDNKLLKHYDVDYFHVAVSGATVDSNVTNTATRRVTLSRHRRQSPDTTDKNVRGFNTEQKRILVEKHNNLRREPKATDMNYMYWDPELEKLAQNWAENCLFDHRPTDQRRDIGKLGPGAFGYVGENLYAGTGGYDPDSLVQLWYDEVVDFNYNTLFCTPNKMCGHYTQIVWATSYAVGCGVAYCPELRGVSFGRGWHVACNYGPGGNYQGERPYKTGETYSKCENDAIFKLNGLCAKYPVIGVRSAASTKSHDPKTQILIGCLFYVVVHVTRKLRF